MAAGVLMSAAESGSASSSAEDSSIVEATIISGSQVNDVKVTATSPSASSSSKVRIPPPELGRYRIEKQLGQGAMGSVYLARDVQLNRTVALKIPHDLSNVAGNFDERFLREARCAATLNHPNICPVYEVGAQDGFRYLAMGFVDGRPLTDFIKPGRQQPERQIAAAVRKIALAVHEAHQQGIIHRDLKPANVMIDRRKEPIVMDFGLARLVDDELQTKLTQEGMKVGTPSYMSPEQIEGEAELGPASDVFSLGIMLYEMLTMQRPFQGSVVSVIGQILHKSPKPIRELRPDVSPQLAAICMKALAKNLDERYASMKEFADDLGDFLKGKSSGLMVTGANDDESAWGGSAWDEPGEPIAAAKPKRKPSRRKMSAGGMQKQIALFGAGAIVSALVLAAILNAVQSKQPTNVVANPETPQTEVVAAPQQLALQPSAKPPAVELMDEQEAISEEFPAEEPAPDVAAVEPSMAEDADSPLDPEFAAEETSENTPVVASKDKPKPKPMPQERKALPAPPDGPKPGEPGFRPPPRGPDIDAEMARFDADEDGILTKDELPPFVFSKADTNKDNKVTRKELENAYKRYREKLHMPPRGKGGPPPRS